MHKDNHDLRLLLAHRFTISSKLSKKLKKDYSNYSSKETFIFGVFWFFGFLVFWLCFINVGSHNEKKKLALKDASFKVAYETNLNEQKLEKVGARFLLGTVEMMEYWWSSWNIGNKSAIRDFLLLVCRY